MALGDGEVDGRDHEHLEGRERSRGRAVVESRGRGTAETQAWLHDNGRVLKMLTGAVSKRQAADLQTFKRLVEAGDADGDVAQG